MGIEKARRSESKYSPRKSRRCHSQATGTWKQLEVADPVQVVDEMSTGEGEANPCKNKVNTVREAAERCKHLEGGDWETPARQAKLETARMNS